MNQYHDPAFGPPLEGRRNPYEVAWVNDVARARRNDERAQRRRAVEVGAAKATLEELDELVAALPRGQRCAHREIDGCQPTYSAPPSPTFVRESFVLDVTALVAAMESMAETTQQFAETAKRIIAEADA